MRLQVEVEWQGEPWIRLSQVRWVALTDAVSLFILITGMK